MTAEPRVIFVDDEDDVRRANTQSLQLAGFEVLAFDSAQAALAQLGTDFPGVVVSDIRMPVVDGLEFFRSIQRIDPELPVILITGHGDIAMAVQAMRDGAYDFLAKPYAVDQLLGSVRRALDKRILVLENRRLRTELDSARQADLMMLGRTPEIERIRRTVADIADTAVDVLVQGETGTGKEVIARALHRWSSRRNQPFVALNCGVLPESIIESELFGHEAGAYTGAQRKRIGKIEHSDGGTLFLDEIESMPLPLQAKLLRVLQERTVEPLGSNEVRPLNLRVVAATKTDLAEASCRGSFRSDLYYRLNVVTVRLPPLRDRRADIPLLFGHFLTQAVERFGRSAPPAGPAVRAHLATHDWPGNVRELGHFAERVVLGVASELDAGTAADDPINVETTSTSLSGQIDAFEQKILSDALTHHKGDVRAAADTLGVARKTLYDKLARHRIDPSTFR